MSSRSAALLAGLALALGACASQKVQAPYDPFKVPRERFYGSLRTVALAPMRTPTDLEDADAVRAKLLGLVEARLRAAGLKVIPPAEVGPVLDEATAKGGGIYDPVTGKLDEAKAKAAKQVALAELREHHGADALLRVDLRVVSARLERDVATWDGATEQAGTGFWKAFLVGSHSGRVPALSLLAWLTAADGTELYAKAGGLRVLGRVNAKGQQERIPHAELFADEARNASAVALALDPLLGTAPQPPAQTPGS